MEKRIATIFIRLTQITVGVIILIPLVGHLTGIDILTRGGFSIFPRQVITTIVEFILLLFGLNIFYRKRRRYRFDVGACIGLLFWMAVTFFVINTQGHSVGLETIFIRDKNVAPSQGTQLIFMILSSVLLMEIRDLRNRLTQYSALLTAGGLLVIALFGYLTNNPKLFYSIENHTYYGMSIPTFLGLMMATISIFLIIRNTEK